MKKALLLSGLQRNFMPFISNQRELLINKNEFDIFIYTSSENNNRKFNDITRKYEYIEKNNVNNDINLFFEKYSKKLKNIIIDNGEYFREFTEHNKLNELHNFHKGLINSYFKVYSGLKMIEEYEKNNNIKYDIIMRARLDSFLLNDVVINDIKDNKMIIEHNNNDFEFTNNSIILSRSNNHIDDSCFIIFRNNINIMKNFVFFLIDNIKSHENISINSFVIEDCLIKYIDNANLNKILINNFICRIGCPIICFQNVKYFEKDDMQNIFSYEYQLSYN